MVGFGLYGSIHGPTDYQVNIQVWTRDHFRKFCTWVSVLCYMFRTFVSALSVSTQIIHTDSNTVLGQNDTGFSCDGSANTFRVMFKEPVEILPNVNYTACATLKVCDVTAPDKRAALLCLGTHSSPGSVRKIFFVRIPIITTSF